jgi:hypothetical protein
METRTPYNAVMDEVDARLARKAQEEPDWTEQVCEMCSDTGRLGRDRDGIVIHCGCWYGLNLMVLDECADIQIFADWIVQYHARVKAGLAVMSDEAYAAVEQAYNRAVMMHDGLETALLRLTE